MRRAPTEGRPLVWALPGIPGPGGRAGIAPRRPSASITRRGARAGQGRAGLGAAIGADRPTHRQIWMADGASTAGADMLAAVAAATTTGTAVAAPGGRSSQVSGRAGAE